MDPSSAVEKQPLNKQIMSQSYSIPTQLTLICIMRVQTSSMCLRNDSQERPDRIPFFWGMHKEKRAAPRYRLCEGRNSIHTTTSNWQTCSKFFTVDRWDSDKVASVDIFSGSLQSLTWGVFLPPLTVPLNRETKIYNSQQLRNHPAFHSSPITKDISLTLHIWINISMGNGKCEKSFVS